MNTDEIQERILSDSEPFALSVLVTKRNRRISLFYPRFLFVYIYQNYWKTELVYLVESGICTAIFKKNKNLDFSRFMLKEVYS